MWEDWGESFRCQIIFWDWFVVFVCVGKMGTGLSQGLVENFRFEGFGVEVYFEGRGES